MIVDLSHSVMVKPQHYIPVIWQNSVNPGFPQITSFPIPMLIGHSLNLLGNHRVGAVPSGPGSVWKRLLIGLESLRKGGGGVLFFFCQISTAVTACGVEVDRGLMYRYSSSKWFSPLAQNGHFFKEVMTVPIKHVHDNQITSPLHLKTSSMLLPWIELCRVPDLGWIFVPIVSSRLQTQLPPLGLMMETTSARNDLWKGEERSTLLLLPPPLFSDEEWRWHHLGPGNTYQCRSQ